MLEKVFAVIGIIFVGILVACAIIATRRVLIKNKAKFGTLYFKDWPDRGRTYHIALDVDLDNIKEGDVYSLKCKREQLTNTEIDIYKELQETDV